jgi:predicted CopG family antitoxin
MGKIIKNIVLEQKTYERLKSHGAMGDSFNDVVNRVLDKVEGKNTPIPRP